MPTSSEIGFFKAVASRFGRLSTHTAPRHVAQAVAAGPCQGQYRNARPLSSFVSSSVATFTIRACQGVQ